ncbi:MAG: hypothetical protein ACT4PT_01290 [Methanobacteriota archaeon]
MTETWWIGLAANSTIAVAFLAVALLLLVNAVRSKHVKNNPLGVAAVILYIGCGGGHAVLAWQLLDLPLGNATAAGAAIQTMYDRNVHMWVFDIFTAIAGVAYWMTRRRFPALVSGAAVFEDLRGRQRRALEIHDNVVQELARAKLALDLGLRGEGTEAVDEALTKARGIITDLLGKEEVQPGALRRREAGGVPHGR